MSRNASTSITVHHGLRRSRRDWKSQEEDYSVWKMITNSTSFPTLARDIRFRKNSSDHNAILLTPRKHQSTPHGLQFRTRKIITTSIPRICDVNEPLTSGQSHQSLWSLNQIFQVASWTGKIIETTAER